MSTSLATVPRNEIVTSSPVSYWVMPDDLRQALEIATIISKTDLCPKDFRGKPEAVFVAAKFGQELGLSIMQSLSGVAVINGHPGVYGDTMLAVIQCHPDYELHEEFWEGEGDQYKAVHIIKRRGQKPHRSEFSVADAKVAHLWDERPKIGTQSGEILNPSPWHRYPKRMLMFRARGFGLRDKFADALRGMKSIEELSDYPNTIEGSLESNGPESGTSPTTTTVSDPVITPAQSAELSTILKASGYTDKAAREEVRAWLKTTFGCETTAQIKTSQLPTATEWAKRPRPTSQAKSADAPKSEAKADQKKADPPAAVSPYASHFEMLGWTEGEQADYLSKMFKFTEAQIRADLNRLIEERDARER